jgi:L-arabinose isomerase
MLTRMRLERKVVVGHWQDPDVQQRIAVWTRAAAAWRDAQGARFARLGDNMREVAVTEGDKVEAQLAFGWSVNGYAMGDLVNYVEGVTDSRITTLTMNMSRVTPWIRLFGKAGLIMPLCAKPLVSSSE